MLVDLCETVRPQLIIADGVLAMEGDGPAGGTPRALGLVLGGEDAYAVDLAVCRLMGMPAMRVPYLAAAHARGLCEAALEEALLRGDTQAAAPVADYKLPAGFADISFADKAPRALRWASAPRYAQGTPSQWKTERRISCRGPASAVFAATRCAPQRPSM